MFCLSSCQEYQQPINEEEYIELSIIPKGVECSITPMATKASSSDMYCVSVIRGSIEAGIGEHNRYAMWVTNDLTSEKFRLLKGDKYTFTVMYIPDGQNILKGVGAAPFNGGGGICPGLDDGICYGGKYGVHGAIQGSARKKDDANSGMGTNGYYFNDVDRYHGFVQVEAKVDATLDVNLYRQMFGLDVVATNFTEGMIRIIPPYNEVDNNVIVLTPSNPSVFKILELIDMPWFWATSDEDMKNHESGLFFTVEYIDADGKAMTILSYDKPIKRMTKLNMTLNVKEILEEARAGLNPKVVSDDVWIEETVEY